jgi:hypothetical protein
LAFAKGLWWCCDKNGADDRVWWWLLGAGSGLGGIDEEGPEVQTSLWSSCVCCLQEGFLAILDFFVVLFSLGWLLQWLSVISGTFSFCFAWGNKLLNTAQVDGFFLSQFSDSIYFQTVVNLEHVGFVMMNLHR